ncbi:IclR family transcriptional regulator [Gordonia rhizosphera]|uniref:Putative IclR family transcriptional regulator n=1 Tax=Gordonia rhizosphera NBRC 16068 TaxID=1108045 RepID=K6WG96_9ACTN|nr:IclR family transcriptional regulator C-terminal domain-containing protein [Gordonia rhizosphera]GAB91197.1 putative IclR family transcriptional regulator [Gordonia rhizosphera NBRC 16068]
MNSIQLLTKAGQIIDELARSGPSTPAELAKAVDEPRPSVYRIAAALDQLEIVRGGATGQLELGPGLLRWGDAVVEAFVDRRELHKQLRWVREQVGMNAYFAVPGAGGLLCLDQEAGAVVDLRDLEPGRVLPLHAGAASHVALAFAPPEAQAELLASADFEPLASGTPTGIAELRALLESTVTRGFSVADSEIVDGIASVAVPVRRDDVLVGVVSVAGLRASVVPQADSAAQVLEIAARAIADSMKRPVPPGPLSRGGADSAGERSGTRSPALILKAGALMEALAAERVATSARLTELTSEPASSVYRMLASLVELGWVEQITPRGAYRVGGKLLTLASELLRGLDIRKAARPILEEIHAATGETTFLCVRNGPRAVCIERIDGVRVNSTVLQLGRSLPLHVGAAPRALLAFEEKGAWDEYASIASSSEDLRRDAVSRSELYAQLEAIREAGLAISDNTVTPGIAAIGAPIFDHYGRVAASLSVSGLRDGILAAPDEGRSVAELVRWGARELSRYLGWVYPALGEHRHDPAATRGP